MADCNFCNAEKLWQDGVIYQDQDIIAVERGSMNIPGYVVIYPVRHVESMADLTEQELTKIMQTAKRVVKVLQDNGVVKVYPCSFGELTPHFHLHLFPRYEEMAEIEEVVGAKGIDGAKLFSIAQKHFKVTKDELLANPKVVSMLEALKKEFAN